MKQVPARLLTACLMTTCLSGAPAFAQDDPTRRATRLDPLMIDATAGFSINRFEVESGVYYRWRIETDGLEEYTLLAPEFFQQIWVDKVVIDDTAVRLSGLTALEIEDEAEIDIWFVPIRPGTYPFFAEGLMTQGFNGEFVVR